MGFALHTYASLTQRHCLPVEAVAADESWACSRGDAYR